MNNIFSFYEEHTLVLYSIHLIISFIISLFACVYISKRFMKTSTEIDAKDAQRLKSILFHSSFFKLLFTVSLHKNNQISIFFFIFLFNITIPLFGYLFSLWISWYLINVKYPIKIENTNILNLDEFKMSFLKVQRIFGEGSMSDLMTSIDAPKSKKLIALSSLANNISPANIQVVRQTLSSTDDEIRMFGYAVINKAETALNQKINRQLSIVRQENLKGERKNELHIALASKELAFLYWEMVYTELSHESLKNNFLDSTIMYIESSKKYYTSQVESLHNIPITKRESNEIYKTLSALCMLMGRVLLSQNLYEQAKAEFTMAQEFSQEDATYILPYLAEVYYATGKYNVVKSILSQADSLELNATLYPIIQQWKVS
ncbi:MAG: hypothetical protein COB42_05370 [Sulfurimonas sp.]|nr:MAG: hypothetical protein COB42_05370 [Sulfurimonas sp.]